MEDFQSKTASLLARLDPPAALPIRVAHAGR